MCERDQSGKIQSVDSMCDDVDENNNNNKICDDGKRNVITQMYTTHINNAWKLN